MKKIAILLFIFLNCSCDGGGQIEKSERMVNLPEAANFPFEIEGKLRITVEEGNVGTDEISSLNFGTLDSKIGVIGIDLSDKVIREAGLKRVDLFKSMKVKVSLVESDSEYWDSQSNLKSYWVESLKVIE